MLTIRQTDETVDDLKQELCLQINEFRVKNKLSQEKFAQSLGMYYSEINNICNYRIHRHFSLERLIKILVKLNYHVDVVIKEPDHDSMQPTEQYLLPTGVLAGSPRDPTPASRGPEAAERVPYPRSGNPAY